ncbi:MAG: hypothetical protein WAM11_07130 [Cyanobium sp.]
MTQPITDAGSSSGRGREQAIEAAVACHRRPGRAVDGGGRQTAPLPGTLRAPAVQT